uniref:Uncharacterized protein n=1 Tax=Physcomitrium patens TaxID=3218 RepID=A0A2K1IEB5_PHYPA|nr:hypothetical protein PHYPA_029770 [Physcomitrium patens]
MKVGNIEETNADSHEADSVTREDYFGDVQNLDHCIKNLKVLGYFQLLIANACSSIFSMIQQRQQDIEYRESDINMKQRFAVAQTLYNELAIIEFCRLEVNKHSLVPCP